MRKREGLMLFLLLVVAMSMVMCLPDRGTGQPVDESGQSVQPTPPPPISSDEINKANRAFVDLAKYAAPAVVNIDVTKVVHAGGMNQMRGQPNLPDDRFFKFFQEFGNPQRDYKQRGAGSGFLIEDGYIVTNNHVISDAESITVSFSDEKKVKAKVLGADPKTDLALLKIDEDEVKSLGDRAFLKLGDSEKLQVGEWVVAIGNPFGLQHTVTAGIVSAKGRVIGVGPYDDYIQTDASINPGNSGGPLIDTSGAVIGINTLINASGQGIGFAIPSNQAKTIIAQLREKGSVTRGWLGISIQNMTPELAQAIELDNPTGVLVAEIIDDPARKAGLKRGDVILEFNGQKVEKVNDLSSIVAATPVGEKVDVVVFRNGKTESIKVEIGEMPSETGIQPDKLEDKKLSINVHNVTPEIAAQLGVEPGQGVVVSFVAPDSPAAEAGLSRGEIILEVNGKSISNTKDFYKQINKASEDKPILLFVKGERGTRYITVKP